MCVCVCVCVCVCACVCLCVCQNNTTTYSPTLAPKPQYEGVCVCARAGSTVFTRSSRLDPYGYTGVLGSGRSPL